MNYPGTTMFYALAQTMLFIVVLTLLVVPLGSYLRRVFAGDRTLLSRVLIPVEKVIYRFSGIDADENMPWQVYVSAALAFGLVSGAAMYALLRTQQWLPFNPQHFANVQPDLAWNTVVGAITTTNWQFDAGENTLSYLSQMAGCGWQNFVAAAAGLALGMAFIRGVTRSKTTGLGNFWVDLVRGTLYVLLPISVLGTLCFLWQGVPQNFSAYHSVTSLEGFPQLITGGPMASQEAVKMLGLNGEGFVAANSVSPNENPTPITNFIGLIMMFLIPGALTYTFGRMSGNVRQGWMIFGAALVLFFSIFVVAQVAETAGNPLVHQLGVMGGNMEGKETRFGISGAGLSLAAATGGEGASNFAYDSLMPLGGFAAMINMQIGEVTFGGLGSGLYGLLTLAILTVFIGGLMVGRTPEYLGKKIERREIQFVMLALLTIPIVVLVPACIAVLEPAGLETLSNAGPHGFAEIIYAFSSSASGNGSSFGGLGANRFYELSLGLVVLAGRYLPLIPTMALAGSMAAQPSRPTTPGTFRTDSILFLFLLVVVAFVNAALVFIPADALGPIVEQLIMARGGTF